MSDPQILAGRYRVLPARVTIPDSTYLFVVGSGPEGNVYLAGDRVFCAVKDRRLRWGFSNIPLNHDGSDFHLAPDGRVWIGAESDRTHYCFNSRGQGGILPASIKPWTQKRTRLANDLWGYGGLSGFGYACAPDTERFLESDRPALLGRPPGGKPWKIPLEQPCAHNAVAVGPGGEGYFQTIDKALFRVTPQGVVQWGYAAPCIASPIYPLASGGVLFSCGNDFYRLHDGKLQWKFSMPGKPKGDLLIDRAETVFAMDDYHGQQTRHVLAIGSGGRKLWDLALRRWSPRGLFLAADGRLFLTGEIPNPAGEWVWGIACLAE